MRLPARPLPQDQLGEAVRRHVAPDRDGEIAVAAAAGAEGDVNVEVHAGIYWALRPPCRTARSDSPPPPARLALHQAEQLERRERRQHLAGAAPGAEVQVVYARRLGA